MHMVAEGVKTTRSTYEFAVHRGLDLPIVRAVHALIYQGRTVEQAIQGLMELPASQELVELSCRSA